MNLKKNFMSKLCSVPFLHFRLKLNVTLSIKRDLPKGFLIQCEKKITIFFILKQKVDFIRSYVVLSEHFSMNEYFSTKQWKSSDIFTLVNFRFYFILFSHFCWKKKIHLLFEMIFKYMCLSWKKRRICKSKKKTTTTTTKTNKKKKKNKGNRRK